MFSSFPASNQDFLCRSEKRKSEKIAHSSLAFPFNMGSTNESCTQWIVRHLKNPVGTGDAQEGEDWHHKLNRLLHHKSLMTLLHVLLIVDVIAVIVSLNLEVLFLKSEIEDFEEECSQKICDPHETEEFGDEYLEKAEEDLLYVSVVILSLFLFHILLLIIANGREFFYHPFEVLDLFVVSISLAFELATPDEASVGLLIVGRAWRFLRIGHGIFDVEESKIAKAKAEGKKECETKQAEMV